VEIQIDQDKIALAMNQTVPKAVEDALKGGGVQSAIAEVVTKEVAMGAIAEAIRQAVKQMDTVKLTQHLAEELQRHTTRAVVNVLQEGMLQAICKLRGIGDYSEEAKKERAKLKVELFSD
jgi:putative NIF3 family GTP cyclohydrolase 1 type 2